jgi:hexosaminidase
LKFAQPGTSIRYTTNGEEPTATSSIFQKPIRITKRKTTIKAKTFGAGFLPSETASATFIKDGLPIASVTAPAPDSAYRGNGPRTFFDNDGGMADAQNKAWIGYRQPSVELALQLSKKQHVRSVLLHFLQHGDNWIYGPKQVQVFYYDGAAARFKKFAAAAFAATGSTNIRACADRTLTATAKVYTDRLKIVLHTLPVIPEGRPGSGQQSWLFIDEIKVY